MALKMLKTSHNISPRDMKADKESFIFYIVITLASAVGALAQTPPPNDNFDNRTVLTGSAVSFGGSLAGATLEAGETDSTYSWMANGSSGSVWWTWTAPVSSTVVVSLAGAQPANNNRIGVYTGTSFSSLTLGPFESMQKPIGRYVRFDAVAGTAYQIQVVGSDVRPFTVQLTATNPPVFILQPQDCMISPYGSAIFSALASGPAPSGGYPPIPGTSYQWFFNGTALAGQTFPSLLVHGVTTNQAGTYSVIASNAGGVTQGGSALLTVTDTNSVPRLAALPPINSSSLNFNLTGEPGRIYKAESSTNLLDWGNAFRLVLTNPAVPLSIQRLMPNHFVRASLDAPTDVCIAQLKQMRWAVSVWAIENHRNGADAVDFDGIYPYIPHDSDGFPPRCPEGGIYVLVTVNFPAFCNIVGHVLPLDAP
jgi:hypothetical protein